MTNPYLKSRHTTNSDDVRAYFDQSAENYRESHGSESQLLAYRLSIIESLLDDVSERAVLLEMGCGTGVHLFSLASKFSKVLGTDLSPKMIAKARESLNENPHREKIDLIIDPAEKLDSITDDSIDVVVCVGALEHMLEKQAVFTQVFRVLKENGAFICLTPNGRYVWYRLLAPLLGYDTKHLSSDRFLSKRGLLDYVDKSGLRLERLGFWRFVPAGDMPGWIARWLYFLDIVGRVFSISKFRGGVFFKAIKPVKK